MEGQIFLKGPEKRPIEEAEEAFCIGFNNGHVKVTAEKNHGTKCLSLNCSVFLSLILPLGAPFSEKPLWGRSETRKTKRRRLMILLVQHDD